MNAYDGGERRGGVAEHAERSPVPLTQARTRAEAPVVDSDEELRDAVDRARRLAEDQPEPFRSLAFSALLQHLLGAAPAGELPPRQAAAPVRQGPLPTDTQIAEFLAQLRLDSHPDRVVAVAYYHYHRQDGQGVTTRDLVDAYAKSRAKRPQNFPDVIASCMRKGYLVEGARRDGMKTWVITRTGESHIEQEL